MRESEIMRLQSPEEFAIAIKAVEADLDIRYPSSAAQLFTELATIVSTGHPHGLFQRATLLSTATSVAAMRDELGDPLYERYLLPFLSDEEGEFPDVYGFDLSDPARDRIAVYAVHTIVEVWPSPADFLAWVRAFVPPGLTPPKNAT